MKRKKKVLAWLITFAMIFTLMPVNASAKKIQLKNCTSKKVMAVGSTFAIKTNQKSAKLKFTSSKKKVAAVTAEGVIQAKKKGNAVITITSGKQKKKIKVTVKKPVGYTISVNAGQYEGSVQPKVKAKKGYVVYYTTGAKFKAAKKIKQKKSKTFTISETTTLKLYVAKAAQKISNLNGKKQGSNYNEYLYVINESAGENPATTTTPSATTTAGGVATNTPASTEPAPSQQPSQEPTPPAPPAEPEQTPGESQYGGDDAAADYVEPAAGEYDETDTSVEAGEASIEVTIPSAASGTKTETANYTISKKNKLTIIAPGTYVLKTESTETASDGLIEVDPETEGLVHIILDGVNLTSSNNTEPDSDTGLITIKKDTQRAIITVKEGTVNTLTDTGATGIDKDDATSTTYTGGIVCKKTPLTINGTGTLNIVSENGNGIKATESLKILDAAINVSGLEENPTGHNGITGKTELSVKNAALNVYADGDALKTTLDADDIAEEASYAELGNMDLDGGTYKIVSANGDAISAYRTLGLNPTTLEAITKNAAKSTADGSYKAIKAGTTIEVAETAGTISADTTETSGSCADDTMHCDGYIQINGGTLDLASADDGIHANMGLLINAGSITVSESYEGIEAADISIYGGTVTIFAEDDGMNAGGGNDSTSSGDSFGKGEQSSSTNYQIIIQGGIVTVTCEGDGIDSNGNIFFMGGTITVNGPTNGGNGALDYGDNNCVCEISGGTLIAAGAVGMDDAPTSGSSQPTVNVRLSSSQPGGTYVVLKDADNNVVMTACPTKSFQSVVMSCEALTLESTYTVWYGTDLENLTQDGEFTFSSVSVTTGSSSTGGWNPGGPGAGGPGGRP